MPNLDQRHYWCAEIINYLILLDINNFFIAPGSRSSPIIAAIARNKKAKIYESIDERSLGFLALGYGKSSRIPGVIVVSSGTAVANLLPSVVEAYMSQVPMLVLTADRPYELRFCGANQTINQLGIFANHINLSLDLAPPSPEVSIKKSQSIFASAVRATLRPQAGPVHVNIQLRETSSPVQWLAEDSYSCRPGLDPGSPVLWPPEDSYSCRPGLEGSPVLGDSDLTNSLAKLFEKGPSLIAVGELLPSQAQAEIIKLAEKTNSYIFADISSNLRLVKHPLILNYFDLALLKPSFISELKFKNIFKLGTHIVSRRYLEYISQLNNTNYYELSESFSSGDPTGLSEHIYIGDLPRSLAQISEKISVTQPEVCLRACSKIRARHDEIAQQVAKFLLKQDNNEAFYASELVKMLGPYGEANLFVSSSMPIRDLDQFAPAVAAKINIYANRGASGIDGIISSTVGIAIGSQQLSSQSSKPSKPNPIKPNPSVLLIGDLAFLHDTNGLMLLKHSPVPILIILINNNGGGIFHILSKPIDPDIISPYIDTPHDIKIRYLCEAHGINYLAVNKPEDYIRAVNNFLAQPKTQILEINIIREQNVKLHKDFYEQLRSELD